MTYASLGYAHPSQLAVEAFARAAGIDLLHVPFRDAGQMMAAVSTGDCDFTVLSMNTAAGMVKSGRWKALAVGSSTRLREFPEIPTLQEAGGPPLVMAPWAALIGVAGTPAPILETIARETLAALRDPELRSRIEAQGFDVMGGTPRQLAELIRRETAALVPLVQSGRVRAE